MSKIVNRDTFLHYLNNADINWEATARECIAKGFELAEENKKLKERLEKIRKYANQLEIFTHIKEDLLNIIEGAEDE